MSALTACIQTFTLIDSQRVHFRDGVRVHGYITDGGQAVNIIPERASAEFSVRASTLIHHMRRRPLAHERGSEELCFPGLQATASGCAPPTLKLCQLAGRPTAKV